MTNEEKEKARELILYLMENFAATQDDLWACEMVINALEQEQQCTEHPCLGTLCRYYKEPCDDAVHLTQEAYSQLCLEASKWNELKTCDDAVSREEAINTAIDAVDDWDGGTDFYRTEIITNAMKQLPSVNPQYTGNEFFNFDAPMVKKSMEQDAISREDAYKIVMMPDTPFGKHKGILIRELPSVTQKSGKWKITPVSKMAYCSECDYLFKDIPASVVEQFDFCPNCGARMESEE